MRGPHRFTRNGEPPDRYSAIYRLCSVVVLLALVACVATAAMFAPFGMLAEDASAQTESSETRSDSTGVSPGEHLSSALDSERSRVEAELTAKSTDRALQQAETRDELDIAAASRYDHIREQLAELEAEYARLKAAWSDTEITSATYGWRLESTRTRLDALHVSTVLLKRSMPEDGDRQQGITRRDVQRMEYRIEALQTRLENQDPESRTDGTPEEGETPDDEQPTSDGDAPDEEPTPDEDGVPDDEPIPDGPRDPTDDPSPDGDNVSDNDSDPDQTPDTGDDPSPDDDPDSDETPDPDDGQYPDDFYPDDGDDPVDDLYPGDNDTADTGSCGVSEQAASYLDNSTLEELNGHCDEDPLDDEELFGENGTGIDTGMHIGTSIETETSDVDP